ncbi:MAG TPA: hypothetical protein VLB12_06925 [Gemmatimonadales bacterium]|nr:hypothetical protein [Gemmatimonadales bacterium]
MSLILHHLHRRQTDATMRTRTRLLLLLTLSSMISHPLTGQTPRPGALMGWWHGTSTCVKAPWNSACNDEIVDYQFVPSSPDSSQSTVYAFKVVGGQRDSMGDLAVRFEPDAHTWNADVTTKRGDIRWIFRLHSDTLVGELLLRPGMQVARHVVAFKGSGQPAAGAPHD